MWRLRFLAQCLIVYILYFFFFNDTATTEIYTLSLHDALPISAEKPALPAYAQADFDKNLPAWTKTVAAGKKTASALLSMLQTKAAFSEEQKAVILSLKPAATDATPAAAANDREASAPLATATSTVEHDEVIRAMGDD